MSDNDAKKAHPSPRKRIAIIGPTGRDEQGLKMLKKIGFSTLVKHGRTQIRDFIKNDEQFVIISGGLPWFEQVAIILYLEFKNTHNVTLELHIPHNFFTRDTGLPAYFSGLHARCHPDHFALLKTVSEKDAHVYKYKNFESRDKGIARRCTHLWAGKFEANPNLSSRVQKIWNLCGSHVHKELFVF